MWSRGRTERRRPPRSGGSIFLDALVALLIGTLALTAALGGLALAARVAGRRWDQALALVQGRNEREAARPALFGGAR
jgi:hypothetical protein